MKKYFVTPGYIVSKELVSQIETCLEGDIEVGVILMDDANPLFPLEERAHILDATVGAKHLDITSMAEFDTEEGDEETFLNLVKYIIRTDMGENVKENEFDIVVEACFPDNFSVNVIDTYKKVGTLGRDNQQVIKEVSSAQFIYLFPNYVKERVFGERPEIIKKECTVVVPYIRKDAGNHIIFQEHLLGYVQDNVFFQVAVNSPVANLVNSFGEVTECGVNNFFTDFTTLEGTRVRVVAVEVDVNTPGIFEQDNFEKEFVWASPESYWNPRLSHLVASDSPMGAWVVNLIEEEHASQEYAKKNGLI